MMPQAHARDDKMPCRYGSQQNLPPILTYSIVYIVGVMKETSTWGWLNPVERGSMRYRRKFSIPCIEKLQIAF